MFILCTSGTSHCSLDLPRERCHCSHCLLDAQHLCLFCSIIQPLLLQKERSRSTIWRWRAGGEAAAAALHFPVAVGGPLVSKTLARKGSLGYSSINTSFWVTLSHFRWIKERTKRAWIPCSELRTLQWGWPLRHTCPFPGKACGSEGAAVQQRQGTPALFKQGHISDKHPTFRGSKI